MRTTDQVDALLKARAEIDEKLRQHKNALTVLFTDVVGSTSFFERNGDTAGLVMIHRHDETAKRAIAQHGGKVIKTIGDSAMAEFPEPASAVRAAVEIERQFAQLNTTLPEEQRVQVRIGIHTGIGYHKGNDVFGDVVNVASRIVRRTAPSQILISRAMYEAISAEEDLHCRWLNRLTMDGRTEKEDIYEVIWTDAETYRQMQDRVASSSVVPPRYEVLSQIGMGGTGIVYKVRDTETSEVVALKVLKPEIASDPEVQENFRRELCLARKITHKNVCRIYEFSRLNGTACAAMEFVEGESLSAKITRAGAMPPAEAIEIARQICAGLREAHAQGIVHRDLKPANVMVDRNGAVKIMDFGIARMVASGGPVTGRIVGTPEYMAPEQAELKAVSARTDVYALGLLLYEMVTGVAAYSGDTPVAIALKQIREYPKRPREIMPELSGAIDAVIMKCLQKDPAKRFSSVEALDLALVKAARARRASAWEIALDRWLENAETQIRRHLHRGFELAEGFFKEMDWSRLTRYQREPMAMLGFAGMAGALTIFVWFGGWKPRTVRAQSVPQASTALAVESGGSSAAVPSSSPSASIRGESPDIYVFESVNLGPSQAQAPATVPAADNAPALKNVSVDRGSDLQDPAALKPSQSAKRAKSTTPAVGRKQQRVEMGAQSPVRVSADALTPALTVAAASSASSSESAVNAPQPSAELEPSAADPPAAKSQPQRDAASQKTANLFLEVGAFRDEAVASDAEEKLTQLGFHTLLMHRNLLWMQSYRVQVGPYSSQKEAAEAQQSLAAQGFKARRVN
jgi:serine/threonine protein kinase/class 3 adenylate cyclase